MKNSIYLALLGITLLSSCNSCNNNTTMQLNSAASIEKIVSMDKEYMFTHYGNDFRWFETCIVLNDWLDSENCDGSVKSITNVFQYVEMDGTTGDVHVIFGIHDDNPRYEVREGFWVEDYPLENENIKLTYNQAFKRIMATNSPKPHSKNCILRKPIGPIDCNPQWIFGNMSEQLWVDVITGEVRNSNPAFEGFNMPLGEWP